MHTKIRALTPLCLWVKIKGFSNGFFETGKTDIEKTSEFKKASEVFPPFRIDVFLNDEKYQHRVDYCLN